jgi:hypothetical protein
MPSRQRILIIVFLAGLGLYAANWAYRSLWADRIADRKEAVSDARSKATNAKRSVIESRAAQLELAKWKKMSLPNDPNVATPQYQAFLLDLLNQCGFTQPTITPGPPSLVEQAYWRMPFDVQTRGSMASLVTFLDAFYRIELLHNLGRLTMTPAEGPDGEQLDLRFSIEALALLDDSQDETTAASADDDAAGSQNGALSQLLQRNLLMTQGPGPGRSAARQDAQVYLTGTVVVGDQPEALLFDRSTGESLVLHLGDAVNVGEVRGQLIDIGRDDMVLEAAGRWYTVALGDNLGRRRPLPPAEALGREIETARTATAQDAAR